MTGQPDLIMASRFFARTLAAELAAHEAEDRLSNSGFDRRKVKKLVGKARRQGRREFDEARR